MLTQFETQVVAVSAASELALGEAAALIQAGELVAFPTETVYGLGADATNAAAVAKIFEAKGRPSTDPVIVHLADVAQLETVADRIPPLAYALLGRFAPGPLTLILQRGERIPDLVSAGRDTVGVRIPAHPVARALIQAAGVPIAAPSANQFAHISPTSAAQVYADLAGRIPLILDGGDAQVGVESTIIDLTSTPPRLLRPGGITLEQLQPLIPDLVIVERFIAAEDAATALEAPGQLLRHYAPRAKLTLFDGAPDQILTALLAYACQLEDQGEIVGLLLADEDELALKQTDAPVRPFTTVGPMAELTLIATNLYAAMRVLDANAHLSAILARAYPTTGIGLAIRDRMIRAAEGRIIRT